MAQATPFLTFQPGRGQSAAEAMTRYVDLFGGEVLSDQRYGPDGPGPEGSVMLAEFTLGGTRVRCSDSFVTHDWTFTPAVSLWVTADSEDELRRWFDGLADGGHVNMPVDDYGFGLFGWVDDAFGVSWQLALGG